MRVFTIFNHGTGGFTGKNQLECQEIINIFGNEVADSGQREFIDYMITEGVGGKGDPEKLKLLVENGTIQQERQETGPLERLGEMLGDIPHTIRQAIGTGVDQNVKNALTVLTWLDDTGNRPDVINMLGWSRGAVTCIRIAYFLKKLGNALSSVPVNIFAVDPVAGFGHNDEEDARNLTGNVRNYIATLALNEKRSGFTPMDDRLLNIEDPETKFCILPLHGIHSDTAKWTNPAGRITFNLAYRFLQRHGTELPTALGMFKMSNEGIIGQYNLLRKQGTGSLHKTDRVKLGNNWTDIFKGGWDFTGGRQNINTSTLVSDSDFFVNNHHAAAFQRTFRLAFEAYFGKGRYNRGSQQWGLTWLNRLSNDNMTKRLVDEDMYILNNLGTSGPNVFSWAQTMTLLKNGLLD